MNHTQAIAKMQFLIDTYIDFLKAGNAEVTIIAGNIFVKGNGSPAQNETIELIMACKLAKEALQEQQEKIMENLLNPAGEYAALFAKNHGMTINEAMEQPMVKARFEYFNATGM